jgi:alkyldihydroxyacetonephosphate synthase
MSERQRSFWGWGYEDKFPNRQGRQTLGAMAAAMLGGAEFDPIEPVRVEDLELRESRVEPPAALAELCSKTPVDRASHTYGKSYCDIVRGFAGNFDNAPDLVVRPRSESDIEAALDWCSTENIALIPFGGGTSVVGGVEPAVGADYRGTVSLDVGHMNRVLELDDVSHAARIQAGALGPELESQLGASGFTLRHFPQSFEFSTLGGWLATRAGGHFATLYTHIDDLTESIRMITPSGVWQSRRLPGSGAGPSPDRLVLGSEGTLGIITEGWMRIRKRPRYRASASVRYRDFADAVHATREIAQSGLYPTNCRLLDKREAMLHRVVGDGSHVLLLGFESSHHPVEWPMKQALDIALGRGGACPAGAVFKDAGAKSGEGGDAGAWKAAFIDAPYLVNSMVSLGCITDTFETACTWDRFDELHAAVVTAVRDAMKRECGKGLVSCRFTHVYPDGPAPYYTFVAPAVRGSEVEQWTAIKTAASEALIANGATITHHHAVGRTHRPWYDRQRPEPFAKALSAAKRELDPAGVLNPGVLIDR